MRLRNATLLFIIFLLFPFTSIHAASLAGPESPDAWTVVGQGIEYQKFHRTFHGRPVNIFITRMDRNDQSTAIESSIAQGRLSGGTETIGGMATRYDQAINYWGRMWGNRNRVVVAINGYFFGNPDEPPGVPWSGQVQSGWYAKRYTETRGDAGFAWTLERDAFIGKCVHHRAEKNDIYFLSAGYDPNIDAINIARADDEKLILYTPQYDATTKTGDTPRAEILVELSRPTLLISDPSYVRGIIRAIRKNDGSTPIPFDHVVIAAWGSVGDDLVSRINQDDIQVGDEVRISQEITDCITEPVKHDWSGVYAGIGGDYHFLRGGDYYAPNNNDATWPNSRTIVAYNSAYVFFIVVDAFDPNVSEGITIPELTSFLRDTLGATDAVSLDSGTSSTMVVNGQVMNNTYCNYTRKCGMQGPVETVQSTGNNQLPKEPAIVWSETDDQAYVGNGLMMVVVEPSSYSGSFFNGQALTVTQQTSLRLGPGSNYATLVTLNSGEQGTVLAHSLNGVRAKGSYWWKATFGGTQGWVKEESLRGGQLPPPTGNIKLYLPIVE